MGTEKENPAKRSTLWPLDMFDEADITEDDAIGSSSRELSQELKEVIALYNVGVVLNSSMNPKEVLWGIYKECSRLVDTSNFVLTIFDPSKKLLNFMLLFVHKKNIKPFAVQLKDVPQLSGEVLVTRTPISLDDLSGSGKRFEVSERYPQVKPSAWLGVPIVNPTLPHEKAQGTIAIWNDNPAKFNDHDLWLLSAVGTQASIALRNARLYESSQRRATEMSRLRDIAQRQTEEMRFLNEVGRTLSSTLHLERVLTSMMEQVDEMLSVEAGSLLLTDNATGDLVFQIALGEKADEVKPFRVPKGQGIAGHVAETGKALIISDVQKDERHLKSFDKKTQFLTRDILCVPLILHRQVVGVLQVLNKRDGEFTQRDVDLLSSIASYAAIAIENARLYESLEAEHTRSIQAEQEARRKLATDLHDGPTQLVAAIMMNLDFATKALKKDPSLLPDTIAEMQELASRASHQMRTLLFELRPLVLETQGLGAALQVFLDRRQKDANGKTNLALNIETEDPSGDITRQDGKVEATIFSIVQETVNNAIKHARADNIVVALKETNNRIFLSIVDDGAGFDVEGVLSNYETRGSLGMINIRERAEAIGGDFKIESAAGEGTKISVDIPKEEAQKDMRIKQRKLTGMLSAPSGSTPSQETPVT